MVCVPATLAHARKPGRTGQGQPGGSTAHCPSSRCTRVYVMALDYLWSLSMILDFAMDWRRRAGGNGAKTLYLAFLYTPLSLMNRRFRNERAALLSSEIPVHLQFGNCDDCYCVGFVNWPAYYETPARTISHWPAAGRAREIPAASQMVFILAS